MNRFDAAKFQLLRFLEQENRWTTIVAGQSFAENLNVDRESLSDAAVDLFLSNSIQFEELQLNIIADFPRLPTNLKNSALELHNMLRKAYPSVSGLPDIYPRLSSTQQRVVEKFLRQLLLVGVEAIITLKGKNLLSELERSMNQPKVEQHIHAQTANVTGVGHIIQVGQVEVSLLSLIDASPLPAPRKEEIKKGLLERIKSAGKNLTVNFLGNVLAWLSTEFIKGGG